MRSMLVIAATCLAACSSKASSDVEAELARSRTAIESLSDRIAALEVEVARLSDRSPNVPPVGSVLHRTTVKISINSQPADADVFVDGRKLGRTPFEFEATTPTFVLRVEKEGYQTAAQTVDASTPSQINIPLSQNK